jgi:hypothetical protein
MKVTRRRGVVRLMLDPVEAQILAGLFDELNGAFDEFDPDDAVHQRLFPDGHRDDAAIAAEYRDLTESLLLSERTERLGQCRAEIVASENESSKGSQIGLGPEETRRWLQVINDLRLAIGTRLGVSEERQEIDPESADAQAWAVYSWLSGMQEALVDAVAE